MTMTTMMPCNQRFFFFYSPRATEQGTLGMYVFVGSAHVITLETWERFRSHVLKLGETGRSLELLTHR